MRSGHPSHDGPGGREQPLKVDGTVQRLGNELLQEVRGALVPHFGSRRRVSADHRGRRVGQATFHAVILPVLQSERLAMDALRWATSSGDTAGAALPQELRM
jgi:hypothetical protein